MRVKTQGLKFQKKNNKKFHEYYFLNVNRFKPIIIMPLKGLSVCLSALHGAALGALGPALFAYIGGTGGGQGGVGDGEEHLSKNYAQFWRNRLCVYVFLLLLNHLITNIPWGGIDTAFMDDPVFIREPSTPIRKKTQYSFTKL